MAARTEVGLTLFSSLAALTFAHSIAFLPQVLKLYRQLHRTCRKVFVNDDEALNGN